MKFIFLLRIYKKFLKSNSIFLLIKIVFLHLLKVPKVERIQIATRSVFIRTDNNDLQTIILNLTGEFNCLSKIFPDSFSGTIIDAGGYIGGAAIALSEIYPLARIITIEPNKRNFEILQMNISECQNIVPLNASIVPNSNKEDVINLFKREGHTELGFTNIECPVDSKTDFIHSVKTVRVSEIEKEFGNVSIMKMDIEGYENQFFVEKSQNSIKNIKVLFCELHRHIVDEVEENFFALKDRVVIPSDGEKFLSLKCN